MWTGKYFLIVPGPEAVGAASAASDRGIAPPPPCPRRLRAGWRYWSYLDFDWPPFRPIHLRAARRVLLPLPPNFPLPTKRLPLKIPNRRVGICIIRRPRSEIITARFRSPYESPLSLQGYPERDVSITSTLFFTARLEQDTFLIFNPEIAGGKGFSGVNGIADQPNGEIPRVASATPKPYIARLLIQHDFGFGPEKERQESDENQLAGGLSAVHREYLAAGGMDFLIGDGRLNYELEYVWESFYSARLVPGFYTTFDVQRDTNPAYNRDRGPVTIYSIRMHIARGLKPWLRQ